MTITKTASRTAGPARPHNRPSRTPKPDSPRHRPAWSVLSVNGILVLGSAYMVLPVLWLVFAATKNLQDFYATDALSFGRFSLLENIGHVLTQNDGVFTVWILNSLLYAGVGAVGGALISVAAGYAFDKFSFRWKERWYGLVLLGVLVPNTATVLPLYLLASAVGLTNTVWAVLIPALTNPFGVYLARVYSAAYIPDETLEAARVDGAGNVRSFFSLGLPMIMPGLVTIALFQFVGIWNNFMLPLVMLSNERLFPLSLGIFGWSTQTSAFPDFYPLVITGSMLSVIPLIIAFVFLQRFWKTGLTAGAVK
ncbi:MULTISPECIES: carbohydrate ABC transporter permease [Arthrobacter]|uniref:Carbohydrate ABC transporter permease n=1 Tax=Arthrobacter terricola TaxID=2547396 RepID=A0A4R5KFD7_9MICC|nr:MULTISPECIES: carbohydrate ABC transporter permease [Arthrobacter]MBT8162422.1 carbohydrate ABC transporter permease [Arthrobacter sp. GN70]TDF93328.1 carbohydrate ABC transporter permease [Arthrobacter terricola]